MACPSVVPDVGADLLAMCQRNIALNGHLTAAGGEAQRLFPVGGRPFCSGVGRTPCTVTLGAGCADPGEPQSLGFTELRIRRFCACVIRSSLALSLIHI